MAEYIEREKVNDVLNRYLNAPHVQMRNDYSQGMRIAIESCIQLVNEAISPTADVAEVRHGKWHKYTDYFTKRQVGWICTNCSAVSHDLSNGDTPFCPHCGAMMDLEDDDDA